MRRAHIKYVEGEIDMYRREGGGYGGGHGGGYGDRNGGGFRAGPQRSFAPVKVGEELEVTIEAVGEKGDGIAKKNGFVLFVPGVKEGQRVKIRVTKVLRKVGFAEVVGQAGEAPAAESGEATAEQTTEETAEETTEQPAEDEVPEPTQDSEDFGEETTEEEQ